MAEPIRVGLAGFGLGGRAFHAPFITANPRLRLTHVLQRHGHEAADRYPGVTIVRDVDALLEPSAAITLVVITTPNATHVPFALRAIEAGKHVVIDKPFALTADEARGVAVAAQVAGKVLAPYQNRRWDGDFLTVRTLLARGWLGDLQSFESRFDRWRPDIRGERWKEQPSRGAGLLFDLGPHLIDQALALFGKPRSVSASILTERPGSLVDDHFEITLEYGGFAAKLGAGMMAQTPGARFSIAGSQGQYVKHGVDSQEEALRAGKGPPAPDWGIEPSERWGTLAAVIDGLHVHGKLRTLAGNYGGFYDNVCDAIDSTAPLLVTPETAIDTIRVIELAQESSDNHARIGY